jgi:hypothetical protein
MSKMYEISFLRIQKKSTMGNNYSQTNSGHAAAKFTKTKFLCTFNSPISHCQMPAYLWLLLKD